MLALDSICIPPVNTLPLGGHIKCLWGGRWCLESELSTEPSVLVQCCSLSSSLQVISKILWHDCWCFVTVSDILIFCLSDAATHDREAVMGNSQRKRLVGEWRYVYQCCCYLCYSVFRVIVYLYLALLTYFTAWIVGDGAILNQTNTGAVLKATLGKLLKWLGAHTGFPVHVHAILNWTNFYCILVPKWCPFSAKNEMKAKGVPSAKAAWWMAIITQPKDFRLSVILIFLDLKEF